MKDENINMFIEINPEKRVVSIIDYIEGKSGGGITKRFKRKKDIVRLFANYLYQYINIEEYEGNKKNEYKSRKHK